MKHTTISEEDFYENFKPVKNPFEADAAWDGSMLETYGREHEHVLEVLKTEPQKVWTVLDCDGSLIASSGYHHVNRVGYIITELPVPADEFIETEDPDAKEGNDDEGDGE